MKVSRLIEMLEKVKQTHGDLECMDLCEAGFPVSDFEVGVSSEQDSKIYKVDYYGRPMPDKWVWCF